MGFLNNGGLVGTPGGIHYDWKARLTATLNVNETTFLLAGVLATDVLVIYDTNGFYWTEGDHYTRQGVNGDTVVFQSPMVENLGFTIFVFE